MTLAEDRLLAWRTLPCRFCRERAGRRCVTSSGARTIPHKPRLDDLAAHLDGQASRQVEVDDLLAAVHTAEDATNNLIRALEASEAAREDALQDGAEWARLLGEEKAEAERLTKLSKSQAADLELAAQSQVKLRNEVADLSRENEGLWDRLYDLEHPEPETPVTRFGACPASPGGTSLAAQRAPFLKYGPCTVRQFFAAAPAPRAPAAEVLRLHASWNLSGMGLNDLTASWVDGVTADLLPGDEVEVIHEADKKVTDGKRTYEECVAYKNRFFDVVEQVRPDLVVVNTLTGGSLANYGGDREERWGAVKAHILGVDCDGVHDATAPLNIPYEDEMVSALAFVKKYAANGYRGITVPEFGTSRPPYDPTGNDRAAWIRKCGMVFVAAGVEEVNAYEFESTPGNEFVTGSPEFHVWRAYVETNR